MHIGVVIVTFNRLDKLKIALESFENQTCSPKYLLVVDNASTDGTGEFLAQWVQQQGKFSRQVISKPKNTGGSGGFYTGLEAAQQLDAQWIWLSDDDAFPEADALEKAEAFIAEQGDGAEEIASICGSVINNGQVDLCHRRRIGIQGRHIVQTICPEEDYEKPFFPLDIVSYVGIIIHKPNLEKAGLTEKDFFIWYDDTEHTLRLNKTGKQYCVPGIRIHHDAIDGVNELTWKHYYGVRNRLIMFKRHFPARYFFYACAFMAFHSIKDSDCRLRTKIELAAVGAALTGRLGLHKVYRPGWKAVR